MRPVMDRETALGDFLKKHVIDRWQEDLIVINDAYMENQMQIAKSFAEAVDRACMEALKLQQQGLKGDIQYIYLSWLRTSMMERRAEYRIDLYDERWFLDPVECSGSWRADFIFDPLFKRFTGLSQVKNDYARKVTEMDIERIMLIEAVRYHIFAVEYMRSEIASLLAGEAFGQMGKKVDIAILAGEYRDHSEILYGGPEAVREEGEPGVS